MLYFYCFGWAAVLAAGALALVAWMVGAAAVVLSALVAGAAASAVLVAVCWCWLKLHE